VAEYLCLTTRRVVRLARDGGLPHVKLPDGELLFDPEELAAWLAQHRRPQPRQEGRRGR
jgi:excisionase family DNA binding protein